MALKAELATLTLQVEQQTVGLTGAAREYYPASHSSAIGMNHADAPLALQLNGVGNAASRQDGEPRRTSRS